MTAREFRLKANVEMGMCLLTEEGFMEAYAAHCREADQRTIAELRIEVANGESAFDAAREWNQSLKKENARLKEELEVTQINLEGWHQPSPAVGAQPNAADVEALCKAAEAVIHICGDRKTFEFDRLRVAILKVRSL